MIKVAILLSIFGATMFLIGVVLAHLIYIKLDISKFLKRHPSR